MSPDDVAAPALRVRVIDLERGSTAEHTFRRSPVTVGRGELNDLQLDRPYVSSWHALIHFDEGGIRFVDLGSTNGTTVDGARLQRNEAKPIAPGQPVTIGPLRLELSPGAADAQSSPVRQMTNFARRVARSDAPPGGPVSPAAASALKLLGGNKPSSGPRPTFVVPPPRAPAAPAPASRPASPAAAAPPPPPAAPPAPFAPSAAPEPFAPPPPGRSSLDPVLPPPPPEPFVEPLVPAALQGLPESALAPGGLTFPPFAPPAREPEPAPAAQPRQAAPAAPEPTPAAGPEGSNLGDDVLSLVRSFAESYLPAEAVPTSAAGVERFLERLAEVLETAVRGFIELRSGHDQFADEMGLRAARGDGAIGRTADAGRLLGWLLEPAEGESRARQLGAGFADLMIHQVALLNGIRAGGQALVADLSPAETAQRLEREGRAGLPVWPLRQLAVLRALEARHGDFADEESAVTNVLFGKEFARAYSAVSGRRAGPSGGDEAPRPRESTAKAKR